MSKACRVALVAAAAFAVTACKATLPADQVSQPKEAIRAAAEMGAYDNPAAALHLKLAKDQVVKADAFLRDGDKDRASWLLVRADADAELAIALTREHQVRAEALAARTKIRELGERTQPNVQ